MSEIERIEPGNMSHWRKAMQALQHNELDGAVMNTADADTMAQALVEPAQDPNGPPARHSSNEQVLRPSLVTPDFNRAALIAYNSSVDEKDRISEDATLPDLAIYKRAATGFHIDGVANSPDDPEAKRKSLEPNIQILGRVAINLLLLDSMDFEQLGRLQNLFTDEAADLDSIQLLKPQFIHDDETIVAQPGDITVFPGHADIGEGRYPVGHQFVSLGETPEEKLARTSAIIYQHDFTKAVPATEHQAA